MINPHLISTEVWGPVVINSEEERDFCFIAGVENRVREVPISLYRVTVLTGKVPCRLLLMKS